MEFIKTEGAPIWKTGLLKFLPFNWYFLRANSKSGNCTRGWSQTRVAAFELGKFLFRITPTFMSPAANQIIWL